MTVSSGWIEEAACSATDAETFFADDLAQQTVKMLCASCPVRIPCLAHALDNRLNHGVWGGMTERERRALLRRRPSVTSWHRKLYATRAGQGRLPKAG